MKTTKMMKQQIKRTTSTTKQNTNYKIQTGQKRDKY